MSSLQTTNISTDLSDGRVGRPGGDEGHGGGGGVVGDHRLLDLLFYVRDVPQAPNRADTLEEGPTGDESGVAVVDDQGLVDVVGELPLHRGRTIREDGAERRVVAGAGDGADLKTGN